MPYYDTFSKVLKKKNFSSQEYQDFISIIIFVSTNFGVKRFGVKDKCLFLVVPSPHLWDSRFIIAILVLEYYSRQNS